MTTTKNKRVRRTLNSKASPAIKYTVLTIIVLSMMAVILVALSAMLSNPERVVKQKITDIASDYYENYLYKKALAPTDTQSTAELAERYANSGFPIITLRQLLLFDNGRYAESANIITSFCDENDTIITIYPESPFSSKNYHIDYHYACTF